MYIKKIMILCSAILVTLSCENCANNSKNSTTEKVAVKELGNSQVSKVEEEYDREISTLVKMSDKSFSKELDDFGANLFRKVAKGSDENVMISPISISLALSMTINGANGETSESMKKTAGYVDQDISDINGYLNKITNRLDDEKSGVEIANSIWYRSDIEPLKKSFYEVVTSYYNSEMDELISAAKVNLWVEDKTSGKIKNLVNDDIVKNSEMLLINAIYFKSRWLKEFNIEATSKSKFFNSKDSVDVEMMFLGESLQCKVGNGYTAIKLPYINTRAAMYLYLPDDSITLESFYNKISKEERGYNRIEMNFETGESQTKWVDENSDIYSNFSKAIVKLYLPKFSYDYSKTLKETLSSMGMEIAFDKDRADFSNISDKKRLYIDNVIHKTFISVDENGTEAAASTAMGFSTSAMYPELGEIKFNRPFFYVIRDEKTNVNLFMGQVFNP